MPDTGKVDSTPRQPAATLVCFGLFGLPKPEVDRGKMYGRNTYIAFLFLKCKMKPMTHFLSGCLYFQAGELLFLLG